jgi:hypothetical protein
MNTTRTATIEPSPAADRSPAWAPSSPIRLKVASGAILLCSLLPHSAYSQSVQGQLLDRDTQGSVEGALVLLLDSSGERMDGYLTNAAGRFLLRAPGPGRYTVRAERIGFETVSSEPFDLEATQILGLRLETGQAPIELEGLTVEGEQQCVVRPDEGLVVAQVWEEARKALTVQEWTEQEGLYRFQIVQYDRELDEDARRVESEERTVIAGVTRNPISSLPAEDLMEEGFVRELPDGSTDYFGPDATVLLSDVFLDTHCFRLAVNDDYPEDIGLAFEPVRPGGVPDIAGTLWLERETAHLDFLEYNYTWSRYEEARGVARGRVEFEGLPSGAWIVRKWWIRMPKVVQDLTLAGSGRSGIRVSGIREAGMEVARISTLGRETISQPTRGTLSGLVWDSTRHAPLADATVYLSGTQYSAVTDPGGVFFLDDLPQGVFTLAFTHPRLDTLGVIPGGMEVKIDPGVESEVWLGVPSAGSILDSVCPEGDPEEGTAAVMGTVRSARTRAPIPEAQVTLEWIRFQLPESGQIVGDRQILETHTNTDGYYSACGVPSDHLVIVQASYMDQESDTVHHRPDHSSPRLLPQGQRRPQDLLQDDGLPQVLRRISAEELSPQVLLFPCLPTLLGDLDSRCHSKPGAARRHVGFHPPGGSNPPRVLSCQHGDFRPRLPPRLPLRLPPRFQ